METENTRIRGKKAEEFVKKYLLRRGYEIIEENFEVHNLGEIDLIARKKGMVVIVEVRSRKKVVLQINPLETVKRPKRSRIIKTTAVFLSKNKEVVKTMRELRFDIASIIVTDKGKYRLRYLEEAFQAKDSWL
ncbi:MAG: YraN family protein [Deltaproteobacteria bacterium]|jgi:putative endonuclease|nr:YraN family protein [Deltaproteobacteria bacterium]